MASRRSRRRVGRVRRRTKRFRRMRSRFRYGRGRMLRRRGRRSRGLTVSCRREYPLRYSSFVPDMFTVYGGQMGCRSGEFYSWSVNILPDEFFVVPGDSSIVGTWIKPNSGGTADGGLITRTLGRGNTWWTDMPLCLRSDFIRQSLNADNLWRMNTTYRVQYVQVTLTVPENTNGERNHHLYVEWCFLPHARAATFDSVRGEAMEEPIYITNNGRPNYDAHGWNWLCRPKDVAEASSIDGHDNKRFGWKRAQLNYNRPVTIRWRPRHAKINFDHGNYIDNHGTGNTQYSVHLYDNYAMDGKLVRSYLPTEIDLDDTQQQHWWLGPIVRILDADNSRGSGAAEYVGDLYEQFGIRCTFSMGVKLKGMKANDPIFPNHNE